MLFRSIEERVKEAISELGYQPNSAARALKVKAAEQICLTLPDLSNPVYQAMIRGVQKGFKISKYRVTLSTSTLSSQDVIEQLQSLGSNYADGLIINSIFQNEEIATLFRRLTIPIVILGSAPRGVEADSIRVDSVEGVDIAVEYLYKKGRKKILFLNGPWMTNPAKLRKAGFIKSLEERGDKNPERHIASAKAFSPHAAVEALDSFKNLKNYSAIVCANDLLAAGAIRYLSDQKISVPEDIAVIGIDNTELAELLNPALTSVDFKAEYRGQLAAKFLLERLEHPETPRKRMVIEPELVVRDSA